MSTNTRTQKHTKPTLVYRVTKGQKTPLSLFDDRVKPSHKPMSVSYIMGAVMASFTEMFVFVNLSVGISFNLNLNITPHLFKQLIYEIFSLYKCALLEKATWIIYSYAIKILKISALWHQQEHRK